MPEMLTAEPGAEKEEAAEQALADEATRVMSPAERERLAAMGEETLRLAREPAPPHEWTPRVERVPGFEETPIERMIKSRESSGGRMLGGGANETRFVELRDDGAVVHKPARGERPNLREGIPAGTYFKREVAAYLVSRFLGFNLVPPTVVREHEGELGSSQEFVPDARVGIELTPEEADAAREDLVRMWLFDYVIWNTDRTRRNFLVRRAGGVGERAEIAAVDNGLSFGRHIPRFFGMAFDAPLPRGLAESFDRAFARPEVVANVRALLEELLPAGEVDACFLRIERVRRWLEAGVILEPEGEAFRRMERTARRPLWKGFIKTEEANKLMVGYRGDAQ